MPKKPGDPIYVSWFVNDGGRKREVNIFQYLSQQIGASTQKWNEFGPGSILFKNGSLKLGNWLTDEAPKNDYTAQVFYLNINTVSAGSTTPEVFAAGMAELFAIVGNPAKIIELERKAYAKMIEHLEVYLSNPGQGRVSAFIMLSQYRDSNKEGEITKESGKIRRRKSWSDTFRPKDRNYTQRWTHLMRNIIMNKNPKVVGGAVLSFSLSDLLSVELSSTNSPLKSIFMMEEFGTGLLADPAYRRPFQSTSATPFKVNPKIANEWDYPEAIYMWFPFFNFLQKIFSHFSPLITYPNDRLINCKRGKSASKASSVFFAQLKYLISSVYACMRVSAIEATELALGVGESWNGLRRTSRPPIAGASEARSKKPPFSASPYFSMARSIVRCAARKYFASSVAS